MRRVIRCAGLVGAALVQLHLGPTTTQQGVDQINRSSVRPLPTPPPAPIQRTDTVWVPDHWALGDVKVPGHYERRMPDGSVYVPPLVVTDPQTGERLVPGHVEPSPHSQQVP